MVKAIINAAAVTAMRTTNRNWFRVPHEHTVLCPVRGPHGGNSRRVDDGFHHLACSIISCACIAYFVALAGTIGRFPAGPIHIPGGGCRREPSSDLLQ